MSHVRINAGEEHVGEVGGRLIFSSVTLTRPADTTAYTAKDAEWTPPDSIGG